ncbi:MAG: hypothetical protein HKO71_03705 [Pseudomonadales bacterium]|nr:hypothetical protein [Pseudomonadales bacterium]
MQYSVTWRRQGQPAAVKTADLHTTFAATLQACRAVALAALAGTLGAGYVQAHEPHSHPEHAPHHRDYPQHRQPANNSPYPPAGYWSAVVSTGLTFGGEKLAEVEFENYDHDIEREDIRAGELFMFSGGAVYTQDTLQLQGTIGYHVDGIFGHNGDAGFTRWPLELLAFLNTPQWRLGGGITHHLNPKLDIDIDNSTDVRVNFKNATGVVLQADYRLSEQFNIGLRHTAIEYETDDANNVEIEGDHTGLILTFNF